MSGTKNQSLSSLQTVREAPLLLKPRLVRAVLADRKRETRRVGPMALRLLKLEAGDNVWFREPWARRGPDVVYRADYPDGTLARDVGVARWRSSLHLARADARLVCSLVEKPWLERLRDITPQGAIDEGTCWSQHPGVVHDVVSCFYDTWNEINQARGYGVNENPEVVVVRFNPPRGGQA